MVKFPYFEKSDPRESSSGSSYEYGIAADGRLTCNCRGWTTKKAGKPRECKHTTNGPRSIKAKLGLNVVVKGDYWYVAYANTAPVRSGPRALLTKVPTQVVDEIRTSVPTAASIDNGTKRFKTIVASPLAKPAVRDVADDAEYVAPMLASSLPEGTTLKTFLTGPAVSAYAMEEKFDGHRVIVAVTRTQVRAWSRPRAGKTALVRTLPDHISESFELLPPGTYDGELIVPGGTSTDVVDLKHAGTEQFIVFDVLRLLDKDTTAVSYDERRKFLEEIFSREHVQNEHVKLAASSAPSEKLVAQIWARGGEGVILKRRAARYQPGVRSADFVKIKSVESAVMRLTGYKPGKNGPHASLILHNIKDGSTTTVKTPDVDTLRAIDSNPDRFVGRLVRIEYQARTVDGGYRHPRFDRWEDE